MLKLTIHRGTLAERDPSNLYGTLDAGESQRDALSNYIVALNIRGKGELPPGKVSNYPRWSGSLWDLVARGITSVLYQSDVAPPPPPVDRRCAYTTQMCAVIQSMTMDGAGRELGTLEILQPGRTRGEYEAVFQEDILGAKRACFLYGSKVLSPADLVLRAICYGLWNSNVLGPRHPLVLPVTMQINGEDRFDLESLPEPTRTGFKRYCATKAPLEAIPPMPTAKAFGAFLQGK